MTAPAEIATPPLVPPAALGVLGAGQLGRMFVHAAQRMGFRAVVLSPTPDAPAAQVADETVLGLTDDLDALGRFAARVEAVTVEFENVSAAALRWLARKGRPARPGWRTVRVSQNRLREKTFLAGIGVPTAPWRPVRTPEELRAATAALGLPLILKTAASGYDGKGQVKVERADELEPAWATLRRVPCVAEGLVTFAAEVSVVAARGVDGATVTYPVCLNRHARHILDTTVCPAPVGPLLTAEAQALASRIATALGTVGVLTVEFFLTDSGALLVNELAPRPHNSGHLTIEAAHASQFDQQVRALAGLPLASPTLLQPAAMANLLGDLWRDGPPDWHAALAADPGVHLHLYGKHRAAPGRKMGHLTVLDPDPEGALARVLAARHRLAPGVEG
jgi:5-(carboxyamino)imidazole ribonucleotide synthase